NGCRCECEHAWLSCLFVMYSSSHPMPQRAGRYAILPNGTLAIHQVSVYDRGGYVCRAANEFGSSLLSVSVIVIAYPPRITSGPPSVTYAKRGVAVQLNCVATGIPKVEVAWETPDKARLAVSGQPRLFGNKYIHPQGSLIIQNPTQKDAGIYRCTARNAIGIDSKATFLNVVVLVQLALESRAQIKIFAFWMKEVGHHYSLTRNLESALWEHSRSLIFLREETSGATRKSPISSADSV
uniref:Ig-like domain-containing protein n=1 Tax=Amphiprion percula TaxID=161767 RepID=A0A3P8RNW6_AMPPE